MTDVKQGVNWDLTDFFPEFNGPEMVEFQEKLAADLEELKKRAGGLGALDAETADDWERVHLDAENLASRAIHIFAYVNCLESADAANEDYAKAKAGLSLLLAEFTKFEVEVLRSLKDVDDEVFDAFLAREPLAGLQHTIRRTREKAEYTMSLEEERLAADLSVDGIMAWGRLYDRVSGKLQFDMKYPDGKVERKGIAQWRALMSNPDREIGRAAFEGGNVAWAGVEDTCAAALNAIAGTRLSLYRHRGIEHYLDQALFQAAMERKTLDAMYEAIHRHIEVPRNILRAKARALGRDGLWWFEREAPLPLDTDQDIGWEKATDMVERAFRGVYPALADYYRSMLDRSWIESEKRDGKRPGAYCTGSPVLGQQRVFMTFNETLSDVKTMAHEVGHAFHGHILKELRPGARSYPMTLAETASIFGEHIFAEGVYEDADIPAEQKLAMLDTDLCGAALLLLDITVRFEFEKAFHEERKKGDVSVSRLKELMVAKQREVMGDALMEGGEDPYFWASKLHFYITGVSFYNFPYTFGFLLARALHNLLKTEGPSFLPKYEEFLRLTGSDTVENVAKRSIGADVADPEFWTASITTLAGPLERYEKLLAERA